jgi:hypothetical protein
MIVRFCCVVESLEVKENVLHHHQSEKPAKLFLVNCFDSSISSGISLTNLDFGFAEYDQK